MTVCISDTGTNIYDLRSRVDSLFEGYSKNMDFKPYKFISGESFSNQNLRKLPSKNIHTFLDFLTEEVMPKGDVYLYGGMLRDLAMFGEKGFNSDIDLVVEGDWSEAVVALKYLDATQNKFGGYRLDIGGMPVDIWNARDTWAVRNGFVRYKDISTLTDTTVLNWDAILMNWRTGEFIHGKNYFEDMQERVLDIVFEENPNPLGMLVRVLRHLYLKKAKKVRNRALFYLANKTKQYKYEDIVHYEINSYGQSSINYYLYKFFHEIELTRGNDIKKELEFASDSIKVELNIN